MTSKITFADRLQSKDALDKSMQWVTKKGSTPWNPGAFKGLDSLELLSETFRSFGSPNVLVKQVHMQLGVYSVP